MSGNELLRSLFKNEQDPVETKITGILPNWLEGTLFRNGPGRYEYGSKKYLHLFDGQSCIHKFKIQNGRVFYSNKFLETKSYLKCKRDQRIYQVFGTVDLCSSFFGRIKTLFIPPSTFDNCNINILPFSNEAMYALTEINFIIRVDPKDLSVLNRINLTSHVPTATTNNAHPHIDNVDGSWLSVAINFKNRLKRPRYEFIRYKAAKNDADLNNLCNTAQVICTIPSSDRFGLSYFHSFGITQNYIILLEQSIKINFFKLIKTALFNRPFSECMVIEKEFQTRIHVIRKENGEKLKQKYLTEPLVAFHHINAYETFDSDNNNVQIICDLIAYNPDKFDISKFTCVDMYTERTIENDILATKAKRLTIPIRSESSATNNNIPIYCDLKELNSFSFEMPCINYSRVNGLKYKYVYGTNYYRYPFSVVKINVDDPNEIFEMKYAADENQDFKSLPSEPVFVERPGATSEDDGVVLVLVLSNQSDYLSILDAKDLKELAKAELNTSSDETEENKVKACFTFHGFFASSSSACSKIFEKS